MQSRSFIFALALTGSLAFSAGAHASAPLPTRDGEAVRVVVNQKPRSAVALKPHAGGWRLQLSGAGAGTAEIVDVTPGTPARMMTVAVDGGELFFDDVRFQGGHVYQVRLRRDKRDAFGFVYLHPLQPIGPARLHGPQRMSFDEPAQPAPSSDEIAPVPKSL